MKTVLFIEDNEDIRDNMRDILEWAEYRVLLAADGREGVAMAIAEKPDIIICDIMMPELDGYGAIHLLQKNRETRHIPFIFLTAKAERTDIRKGMELGADDYITKPFNGTELLNAIEGRLKRAAELQALRVNSLEGLSAAVSEMSSKSLQQLFDEDKDSRSYEKKEHVYNEGQRPFRLFYVESGSVKILKRHDDGKDLVTSIIKAGDFFGYAALMEGNPYRETAEALERSEISSITKEAVEGLMRENPGIMRQFIRMLSGNVLEKEELLLNIAYNSLRKKVAEALILLHRKNVARRESSPTSMYISRDTLAAMAGTATESLIRTLGDFRNEGLVDVKGGEITILQEKKLEKMLN